MAEAPDIGHGLVFEHALKDLLGAMIERRLGWTLLDNQVQPPGAQFGKDITTTFRVPAGQTYTWHTECKGHEPGGTLKKEQVLPKLLDLWRSDLAIDVWCLALAHIELSASLKELIGSLAARLELPFTIVCLSQGTNGLKDLFSCEPALHDLVYAPETRSPLDEEARRERVEAFGQLLVDAASETRAPRVGTWQLVTPARVQLEPDSPEFARAYLRGFEPGGWESVAYGWATPRASSGQALLERVQTAPPGFSFAWLSGSAGEGKSTVLRQVAWEAARADPELLVLWTSAESRRVVLPLDWIELLRPGTRLLLCVDTTVRLEGAGALRSRSMALAGAGTRVVMLLADRGIALHRSPARRELARWTTPAHTLEIAKLNEPEVRRLVDGLVGRGLIPPERADLAVSRIREASGNDHAPGTSRLLPAMMQITDPLDRNFEQILESVLVELKADERYDAARLLLAAALTQAADCTLDETYARNFAALSGRGLDDTLEALDGELKEQGLGRSHAAQATLVTQHRLVAEAYVTIGVQSPEQHRLFLEVCNQLVETARDRVDPLGELAVSDFAVIYPVNRYLSSSSVGAYEQAVAVLDASVALDPKKRNFLDLQQLGVCLRDWAKQELDARSPDLGLVRALVNRARATFLQVIATVRYLQLHPEECSPRRKPRLAPTEIAALHAWAMVEGLAGEQFEGRPAYVQSAMLALMSFGSQSRKTQIAACGRLAYASLQLEAYDQAASFVSALAALEPRDYALHWFRRRLAGQGVAVPQDGLPLLDEAVATLATSLTAAGTDEVRWPPTRPERTAAIVRALDAIAQWLPVTRRVDEVRAELSGAAAA